MKLSTIVRAPYEWARVRFGSSAREKMREAALTRDPTQGYRAMPYYSAMTASLELPYFTVWWGRAMLASDPTVQFGLDVRNAALMAAEINIKCGNQQVHDWLQKQWQTLWGHNRHQITSAKRFGYSGLQVNWKKGPDGLLHVKGLKDFAPEDLKAVEHNGHLAGFRIRQNVKVFRPRALWLTFAAEHDSRYGVGILRRQYPPWYEKWMDHGAKKLGQLAMMKDAYIGDYWQVPYNMAIELPDGTNVPWKDVARAMGENRMSGGVQVVPSFFDDNGNQLVKYNAPQSGPSHHQIFDWEERLDKAILKGASVPIEVVEAQENGGFSGRSIPFMVVLSTCTQELTEILQCVDRDILRPMAWLNFGRDPDYEITAKSLLESFAKDTEGNAMGGGAIGGQPSQRQPPPRPQSQPQPGQGQGRPVQFEEGHSFSSTQFNLPGELAFAVRVMGDRIDSDDLADDGREDNPHVTVKYGLHTNNVDDIYEAVLSQSPVAITFGKTSVFSGENADVVKIEIESKAIHTLNAIVASATPCTDTHPTYQPHCTIAYVKPGLGDRYAASLNDLQGKVAVFDRLVFSNKNREHITIPLTGTARFEESSSLPAAEEIAAIGSASAKSRIRSAAQQIADLTQKKTADLGTLELRALWASELEDEIRAILENLRRGISSDLQATLFAGQVVGAADVAVSVPVVNVPPVQTTTGGDMGPPANPPPSLGALFPDDEEPGVSFPVLDDALEVLANSPASAGTDYRATAEKVREGAFAITGELTDEQVAEIRDIFERNLAEGPDLKRFTDEVQERLGEGGPLSESRIEQVFRTNTQSAYSDGANRSLENPLVSDAFPYRSYFATTDRRVRHTHIALEKLGLNGTNIYRADDPTWQKFRPPWDYSCRCSWAPTTVEQAARAGVTEAKEWLARAEALAAANGGRPSEYLSRTAPRGEWVQPPDFEPPQEFRRA